MQKLKNDRAHTDISALKVALMSDDLPHSRCDNIYPYESTIYVIGNTHFSDNENSESVDDGTVLLS